MKKSIYYTILSLCLILGSCGKQNAKAKKVAEQVCSDIQDYLLPKDENKRLLVRFAAGDKNIKSAVCDCFTEAIKSGLGNEKYSIVAMDSMLKDKNYRINIAKHLIVDDRDKVLDCYTKKTRKLATKIQEEGIELIMSIMQM